MFTTYLKKGFREIIPSDQRHLQIVGFPQIELYLYFMLYVYLLYILVLVPTLTVTPPGGEILHNITTRSEES